MHKRSRIRWLMICLVSVLMMSASSVGMAKQVTLTAAIIADDDPILVEAAREYEAMNPGVKIELQGSLNRDQLLTRFAGGAAPDMFRTTEALPFILWAQKQIAPLPPPMAEKMRQTFYPAAVEGLTRDGQILAYPNWANVTGMWVDRSIMSENGVGKVPGTWDEFAQVAQRIAHFDKDGKRLPALATIADTWHLGRVMLAIIRSEGGDLLSSANEVTLSSAATMRAFDKVISAVKEKQFMDIAPRGQRIGRGEWVPFSFGFNYYPRMMPDEAVPDIEGMPIPAGSAGHGAVLYHHVIGVTEGPNKDEAFKFLDFLAFQRSKRTGLTPLIHSSAAKMNLPLQKDAVVRFGEYYGIRAKAMADFMQNMDYAVSILRYIGVGTTADVTGGVVAKILGGKAPSQAIAEAETSVRNEMKNWEKTVPPSK